MLSIINKRSLGALNHNNTLKKLNKHIQKTRDIKLFIEFLKQGHYDIQVLANNQKNYIITDTHYNIKIKFINHIEQTVKTIYDIDLLNSPNRETIIKKFGVPSSTYKINNLLYLHYKKNKIVIALTENQVTEIIYYN